MACGRQSEGRGQGSLLPWDAGTLMRTCFHSAGGGGLQGLKNAAGWLEIIRMNGRGRGVGKNLAAFLLLGPAPVG